MSTVRDEEARDLPLVCTLTEDEQATRREEMDPLFDHIERIEELPDGYAVRFPGDEALLPRLAEFIRAERDCCRFFTFELVAEPGLGPIWLRLRGADGVKAIVGGWSWVAPHLASPA
jgi:hypothetical protein